ncbi:hypothetical protein GGI02_003359 [Coemansia sp. RSA 2322]|nr:hypothetical protein GGI02_003359 [Coemansia sp. RSA 2322]
MNSHVYFLIDTGALADGSAVSLMITRILVYLAAKNEAVTWNYETIDMRARQRSLAGHWKRKACARKQLTVDAINELTASLSSVKYTHDSATTRRRPALDGLHERLMCLEADVEWEDPALIRSPTRNSSLHSWTDPTRLNESVSVRSHLYIIGQAPQTLFELDEFVCGLSTHNSQGECRQAAGGTLLENLTKLRDGFIGNGIWESYARKRVGVSWIQPAGREDLADLDPVDILIRGVFGCCLEALGGCVINMAELVAETSLPFSSVFAPLHRTRTYPSWSRKFAREISAVIDRFAMTIDRDDGFHASSDAECSRPRECAAIEDVFDANEQGKCSDKHGKQELYCAMRWQATQALADEESVRRDWQLRECQLQILLHLFAIERLRVQNSAECSETDRLVESLHELVDFLCVRVSLGDIYTRTGALGSNQNGDKTSTMVGGEVDDGNDFAAAFIGGASVAKFAGTLGDIVEELRIQCGWVPPVTREVQPKQLDQAEVLPEGKRRKGTPRKISKSSGERSEVIVRQPKLASRELSGRKLARHLDELIGGNKGPPRYDEASSSEGGGSSPSSWAAERRRQSLQPRLPAHLIRQIKTEVVSTSRPVLRTASATLPEPATAAAASRISSGGFACSLSSRSLGRSSSTRRKPLRRPALLACQNTSSSPPNNCRVDNLQVISEAQLSKRRRTGIHMPLDSSPPAFLQSSLVTPSNFVCGSDDDDDDGMQQMHGLGSKRALQF